MQESTITTDELRRDLPEIQVKVKMGQSFTVTNYRRPVFRIVPVEAPDHGERLARDG